MASMVTIDGGTIAAPHQLRDALARDLVLDNTACRKFSGANGVPSSITTASRSQNYAARSRALRRSQVAPARRGRGCGQRLQSPREGEADRPSQQRKIANAITM